MILKEKDFTYEYVNYLNINHMMFCFCKILHRLTNKNYEYLINSRLEPKNCKVTYGAEQRGCYRYTSGTHDGYKYRSPSSGELDDGNGGACTGTGLSAAFRKKVYYSCN